MQITIIDVGQPNTHAGKNGRSYQSIEVTYKSGDGKVASKKLMSFSNPAVFKAASSWTKGQVVDVNSQKDDQGYWQWTGIGTGDAPVAQQQTQSQSTPTRVTGSNYETKEERQARQVFIIRQSSIASAISALTAGAKSSPDSSAILELAKTFEYYVLSQPDAVEQLAEMEDDIPV